MSKDLKLEEPDYIAFDPSLLLRNGINAKAATSILSSMSKEGEIILDTSKASLRILKSREMFSTLKDLEKFKYIKEESYGSYVVNPDKVYKGPNFNYKKAKRNWTRANKRKDITPGDGTDTYCVYMHYFPNGKYYVGISRTLQTRWDCGGKGYKENKKMYEAIQEYGWKNIRHRVVCANLTKEEALAIEKTLIRLYGFNKLYNRV